MHTYAYTQISTGLDVNTDRYIVRDMRTQTPVLVPRRIVEATNHMHRQKAEVTQSNYRRRHVHVQRHTTQDVYRYSLSMMCKET